MPGGTGRSRSGKGERDFTGASRTRHSSARLGATDRAVSLSGVRPLFAHGNMVAASVVANAGHVGPHQEEAAAGRLLQVLVQEQMRDRLWVETAVFVLDFQHDPSAGHLIT